MRAPTDGELYREKDHDGAASVSFVRCTTLPWFSPSAGLDVRTEQPSVLGEAAKTPTAELEGERGVQMV